MSPATLIPDDPITSENDDFLGRARFANGLSDLIINAPRGMTLRIGIYGGWGEGKTSVLELMRQRLRARNHVCVFLQSWASISTDALLQRLIKEIITELGISVAGMRQWAAPVSKFLKVGRKVATSIDSRIKAADAILGDAVESLLGEGLKRAAEQQTAIVLQKINDTLGERKLIVFVDDLDRVRPELVPELLLTLREALNQPNYFYVMALAPDIVQAGLESLNKKWGETTSFLEKIIELPRQLPQPTTDEIRLFVGKQLERLGGSQHRERLEDLRHVLSPNPRKLKSFLRYIGSLQPMLDRFDPAEIEWGTFYITQMLRIEFPLESARVHSDDLTIDDLERAFIREGVSKDDKEKPSTPPYLKYAPNDGEARDRFVWLCEELRKRGRWHGRFDMKALLSLPDDPPIITWKEMEGLLDKYTSTTAEGRTAIIDDFLGLEHRRDPARIGALFKITIEVRQGYLNDAIQQLSEERLKEQLAVVAVLDDILLDIVRRNHAFSDGTLSPSEWYEMFSHFEKWAHFEEPAYHAVTRERERTILGESIQDVRPAFASGILNQWRETYLDFGEKRGFRVHVQALQRSLHEQVAVWALSRLSLPDGLAEIHADEQRSVRDVLFSPRSPLYTRKDLRETFEALASAAKTDKAVNANFARIVSLLNYGAFGSSTSLDIGACREMLRDHSLLAVIWLAATARAMQPRYAGSVREFRTRAIRSGVPENVLPVPPWLADLEKTFFAKDEK